MLTKDNFEKRRLRNIKAKSNIKSATIIVLISLCGALLVGMFQTIQVCKRMDAKISNLTNLNTTLNQRVEDLSNEVASMKVIPTSTSVTTDISLNSDLLVSREIDVRDMNKIINYWSKTHKTTFTGQGIIFIRAAQKSGLDPVYILAHACIESRYGTSNMAVTKHNYFGISAYDWSPQSAYEMGDDMESGIINGACWIREHFYDKGATSLYLMRHGPKTYASDPDWDDKILAVMKESYSVI